MIHRVSGYKSAKTGGRFLLVISFVGHLMRHFKLINSRSIQLLKTVLAVLVPIWNLYARSVIVKFNQTLIGVKRRPSAGETLGCLDRNLLMEVNSIRNMNEAQDGNPV